MAGMLMAIVVMALVRITGMLMTCVVMASVPMGPMVMRAMRRMVSVTWCPTRIRVMGFALAAYSDLRRSHCTARWRRRRSRITLRLLGKLSQTIAAAKVIQAPPEVLLVR
jgi:hypothetical protein